MMRYRIEAIDDDGRTTGEIDLDAVKIIPPGGTLVFCLPLETLSVDFEQACAALRRFFGTRPVLVMRGNDIKIYAIADSPGVSTEGASWAMEKAK